MRALPPPALSLFAELIERVETRDEPFTDRDGAWGTRIAKPPGKGWRVLDFSREKTTVWMRRIPIVWRPVRTATGWARR
jgi:hypothetical protein